jgi:diguanylate cyclase (GGDEF)-like protein
LIFGFCNHLSFYFNTSVNINTSIFGKKYILCYNISMSENFGVELYLGNRAYNSLKTNEERRAGFIALYGMNMVLSHKNAALEYQVNHDELTGALNRRGLEEHLKIADTPKAVLFIDATNFKAVNDEYSHERGDEVIKDNYAILQNSTRPTDAIARIGGDEFIVVLNGEPEPEEQTTIPYLEAERRKKALTNQELIELAKRRIAQRMRTYLQGNPDLQAVNYDLAVGGIVWKEEMSLMDLITTAEEAMKLHKYEQHEEGGQYR